MEVVGFLHPLPFSALPPCLQFRASPIAISRRTSYYQVRLEFLPQPQLIPSFCTANGFGPPPAVTRGSPWLWLAHLVSGFILHLFCRPIKTRFPYASVLTGLRLKVEHKLVGSFFNRHAVIPLSGTPTLCK